MTWSRVGEEFRRMGEDFWDAFPWSEARQTATSLRTHPDRRGTLRYADKLRHDSARFEERVRGRLGSSLASPEPFSYGAPLDPTGEPAKKAGEKAIFDRGYKLARDLLFEQRNPGSPHDIVLAVKRRADHPVSTMAGNARERLRGALATMLLRGPNQFMATSPAQESSPLDA